MKPYKLQINTSKCKKDNIIVGENVSYISINMSEVFTYR